MSAPESAKPVEPMASRGPASLLSDETLVTVALESAGRFAMYQNETQFNRLNECRGELLHRLADRASQRQPETRDERAAFEATARKLFSCMDLGWSEREQRYRNAAASWWELWKAARLAAPQDRRVEREFSHMVTPIDGEGPNFFTVEVGNVSLNAPTVVEVIGVLHEFAISLWNESINRSADRGEG